MEASTNISYQQASSSDDQTLAQIARQSRRQQNQFDLADHDDPAKDTDIKKRKKTF